MNIDRKIEALSGEIHEFLNGIASEHFKNDEPLDPSVLALAMMQVAHDVLVAPIYIDFDNANDNEKIAYQRILSTSDAMANGIHQSASETATINSLEAITPVIGTLVASINTLIDFHSMASENECSCGRCSGKSESIPKSSTPIVKESNVIMDFMESIKDIKHV